MHTNCKNTFKRLRVWAAALALALALAPASASAASVCTVNVSRLNVRSQPSTNSKIVTVVRQGTQLPLIENAGGWLKVEVNGSTGYVFAEYATVSNTASDSAPSSAASQPASAQTVTTAGAQQTGVVTVDKLNVRSGPSTSSKALGVVKKGAALTVTGQTGDWLQV
ncbi:MAG: SH3 domain-containing protein, partial [Clostridia bacterium]|nr:SH3 domain-containing protein [Clostridia bacterium]